MTGSLNRRCFVQGVTLAGSAPGLSFAQDADARFADRIFVNGRVSTMDARRPSANAIAVKSDKILAVGSADALNTLKGAKTTIVDLQGRRVIPGLNDSHMHFVRGSLSYNLDVRWDGVPTLAMALERLRAQVARTPPGQWIRVGGGWSEFQFRERRGPTPEELNRIAPDTPVYVLYFYDKAFINAAGLRRLAMDRSSTPLPGGKIMRDGDGNPTGVLLAAPLPGQILAPLATMPNLSETDAENSIQQFARELNRLGITSVIDPGGVGLTFPAMYGPITKLAADNRLTLRLAMYLLPQTSGGEVKDFESFMQLVKVGGPNRSFRFVGGGELLAQKAMDWDMYSVPPVTIPAAYKDDLAASIRTLVRNGWAFRQHATFDNTISVYLDAIAEVNKADPVSGVRWTVDHAELISDRNVERVARMGGGIAIQNRAAFHGELGVRNFGAKALAAAPPINRMLALGIPVGAGTDATRDSSYNPWPSIQWLVTGKTVGGYQLESPENAVPLETALRLYTAGSAWFSGEESVKGSLAPGMLADFAVLDQDIFAVPSGRLSQTRSLLTVVGGKPVYGAETFASLAPPAIAVSPAWSPAALPNSGYYSAR